MELNFNEKMTHKELVEICYRWILKSGGMTIAFKELYSLATEIPDVIGFNGWESMVIECKVSRSDFLKDRKKPHREKGMGKFRLYACPKGLIRVDELPPKWGLIYVENSKARIHVDPRYKMVDSPYGGQRKTRAEENDHEVDWQEERLLLFTVIRRLFIKGYVKHIYDKQYNRNTTVNELILLNSDQESNRSVARDDDNDPNPDTIN